MIKTQKYVLLHLNKYFLAEKYLKEIIVLQKQRFKVALM